MVSFTILSGNAQLTRMLRSLANIFHYTIRKPGAIVSLHEELNYVQVETDQETVTIRVANDGPGMTPERLREINDHLRMDAHRCAEESLSIGLTNIHHRIGYTYQKGENNGCYW